MTKKILFFILILCLSISAQMRELEISPHHINFMNHFERIKTVRISNYESNEITIDSISYDSSMLYIRNNDFASFPQTLSSNSSISIDVLLNNYFVLLGTDSSSVVSIYNNGSEPIKSIDVNANFEMKHGMNGVITGSVKDSSNYL